ncbi:TagK domain-containing protein [Burkholderia sp. BCC1988]|uniref:TagK domain-containing protein n=1 Tax=Burkholderia sp. BCC1988 TaxID=2817443 RepID=UPI002AB1E669|nr:TagK domain-containing protein [Burkholderia sp. BCC1988]
MRSLRLPWRHRPEESAKEPVPNRPSIQAMDVECANDPPRQALPGSEHGCSPIFELIGGTGFDGHHGHSENDGGASLPRAPGNSTRPHDVIDDLHAQYWRALTDPHASLTGSWAPHPDEPSPDTFGTDARKEWESVDGVTRSGSIETLLSGERSLEDVFGLLEPGTMVDLDINQTPEILRLFAPPEFHGASTRHAPVLPPSLTRREHHALSMDSPLSAPSRKDEG